MIDKKQTEQVCSFKYYEKIFRNISTCIWITLIRTKDNVIRICGPRVKIWCFNHFVFDTCVLGQPETLGQKVLGARSVIGDNTLLIGASVRLTLLIKRNASWMQLPLRFYHFWNTQSGRVCLDSIARVCQRSTACATSSLRNPQVRIMLIFWSNMLAPCA